MGIPISYTIAGLLTTSAALIVTLIANKIPWYDRLGIEELEKRSEEVRGYPPEKPYRSALIFDLTSDMHRVHEYREVLKSDIQKAEA